MLPMGLNRRRERGANSRPQYFFYIKIGFIWGEGVIKLKKGKYKNWSERMRKGFTTIFALFFLI
jgi:hypothetical protein